MGNVGQSNKSVDFSQPAKLIMFSGMHFLISCTQNAYKSCIKECTVLCLTRDQHHGQRIHKSTSYRWELWNSLTAAYYYNATAEPQQISISISGKVFNAFTFDKNRVRSDVARTPAAIIHSCCRSIKSSAEHNTSFPCLCVCICAFLHCFCAYLNTVAAQFIIKKKNSMVVTCRVFTHWIPMTSKPARPLTTNTIFFHVKDSILAHKMIQRKKCK